MQSVRMAKPFRDMLHDLSAKLQEAMTNVERIEAERRELWELVVSHYGTKDIDEVAGRVYYPSPTDIPRHLQSSSEEPTESSSE